MNLLKKYKQDKFLVIADQIVVSGAAFLTNLLLARALGLSDYGRFAGFGMIQLFLLSVSMGFSSQVYQVCFPSMAKEQRSIYTTGLFFLQVLSGLGMTGILLLAGVFAPALFPETRGILPLASLAIFLFLMQDFLRKVLITQQKAGLALSIDVITNLLQLLVLCIMWMSGRLDIKMAWAIIGITFLPSVVMGIYWIKPLRFSKKAIAFSWSIHRKKSSWLIGSSLLQWSSGYFFVLAAGWWLGAASLGALRLVQYIFGLLNVLLQAVENYALPRAAGNNNKQLFTRRLAGRCLSLMLPPLLLLVMFARPVLEIAGGSAYGSYAFLMYGLAIVYLLITIGYPVRIAIRSLQLNRQYFTGYVLSIAVSMPLAPLLLTRGGLYGVLAGLLITQMVTIGYWLYILHLKKIYLWK